MRGESAVISLGLRCSTINIKYHTEQKQIYDVVDHRTERVPEKLMGHPREHRNHNNHPIRHAIQIRAPFRLATIFCGGGTSYTTTPFAVLQRS